VVVVIWSIISLVATLKFAPVTFRRLSTGMSIDVGVMAALIIIRLGFYRAASMIYLTSMWTWGALLVSSLAGIRSPALMIYVALPVSAAWLLGYGASLWTAAVSVATVLVFAVLEITGMAPRSGGLGTPLGIWFLTVHATLISTLPVGLVIRRLRATIAERESAEAAVRESEERFRGVFEEGPLGLGLVGRDTRFVKVNNALCRMVGYSEAELVRMSFTDITHPDDVRADVELSERVFKREIPFYRMQKRYVKKTGEIIWVNLTACVLGPEGEPLYRLGMIEDITELKRTQEEAILMQKLESVGTLAGGIAHDFNNLLGAVRAQAELALSELDAGSSCKQELKTIGEVAARGSEIVRQLMIYSGKETEDVGLVDLSNIVEEMLLLLRASVTKRAVIEPHLDRDLPPILANAAQLRQIVLNLITNASDAIGDRDGVIRVITLGVTLNGESAAASFTSLADGNYVQLEVSDSGHGISTETQAKVFDPFFTTKSAGRGLGLAVVQGIVRSLRGAIHLRSEMDKGTTFKILLPCAERAAYTNSLGGNGEKVVVPTRRGTVLVVEDEDPLRQAVVKMLCKAGFVVFEAADGASAIARLRADEDEIDVMLLDLTIPGASHHQVVAEAAKAKPNIGVILTSAYGQEMIGEMSPLQIRGFIRKPFQFVDLLNTLRNALSGSVANTPK
jgi:PAS domain S-box-containing protein